MLNAKFKNVAKNFSLIQKYYNDLIINMNTIINSSENLKTLFTYKDTNKSKFNFLNIPIKLGFKNKIDKGIITILIFNYDSKSYINIDETITFDKLGNIINNKGIDGFFDNNVSIGIIDFFITNKDLIFTKAYGEIKEEKSLI